MVSNSTEYNKEYYNANKEKMHKQMKEASKRQQIRNIIKKLNNDEYKRTPYQKIEKYNIKQNEKGEYYI